MKHALLVIAAALLLAQQASAQKDGGRQPHVGPGGSAPRTPHADRSRGNAPANDDCANAEAITVTADCATLISGDNTDATQDGSGPSCDNSGAWLDVWYTFNTGAEDTIAITLTPSAQMTDWAFVIYDACGGAEIACVLTPVSVSPVLLAPGNDYWLRVYSNTFFGDPGPFTLCVSTPGDLAPPPPNDLCANVVAQPLAIGSTLTFTGTTVGAIENDGGGYPSVWEGFTLATCADVKISYCGTAPAFGTFYPFLNMGCPPGPDVTTGSYENTTCGDGNFTLCFPDLPPGDYFYAVIQTINSLGAYTLLVSAEPCGTNQAVNDDCAGAIPLTAAATCITQTFSPSCASQSLPAVDCGGFIGNANDDVWYSFMATATDMTVGGLPNGTMDIAMELFSGSCGSLTSIACGDIAGQGGADDLIATGLTIGSTYYLRVYDYRTQYAWQDPSYQLCVVEGLGSSVGLAEPRVIGDRPWFGPNPATDLLLIGTDTFRGEVQFSLMDAQGRVVHEEGLAASRNRIPVTLPQDLPSGLYMLRLNDGTKQRTGSVVIE